MQPFRIEARYTFVLFGAGRLICFLLQSTNIISRIVVLHEQSSVRSEELEDEEQDGIDELEDDEDEEHFSSSEVDSVSEFDSELDSELDFES